MIGRDDTGAALGDVLCTEDSDGRIQMCDAEAGVF